MALHYQLNDLIKLFAGRDDEGGEILHRSSITVISLKRLWRITIMRKGVAAATFVGVLEPNDAGNSFPLRFYQDSICLQLNCALFERNEIRLQKKADDK